MEQEKLQKSILQTLAYWDIFEYPLTKEELWRFLYTDYTDFKLDYTEFLIQLDSLHGVVEQSRGFYFLPGQEEVVAVRQNKVKWIEKKMKIAKRGIKKLFAIPFVRAVFVCNTVAMGTADKDSDIDILIIARKGRIFLVRVLSVLVLSLFRLRRTKKKINNKICLSFYLADDNLNLEKIAIKDDIYLVNWLNNLIPVYDPDDLHEDVLRANGWVNKYLVNGLKNVESGKWKVESGKWFKGLIEKMWGGEYGNLLEKQAKGAQLAKMKLNYTSVQNANDTRVVVSDSILKFHEKDKREEYRDKWLEKCKKIF